MLGSIFSNWPYLLACSYLLSSAFSVILCLYICILVVFLPGQNECVTFITYHTLFVFVEISVLFVVKLHRKNQCAGFITEHTLFCLP